MEKPFSLKQEVLDALGIGLFKYQLKPKEGFEAASPALMKMAGKISRLEEIFVDKALKDKFLKILSRNGKVRFFEARCKNKGRKRFWVTITASKGKKGRYEYIEGIIEDISGHKEKEEKVALERNMFEGLLDNLPDAVYFKDTQNRITWVNKFYIRGIGRDIKDIIGKTDFDFFPYEQAKQMFDDDLSVMKTGRPIVGKIERTLLTNGTWNQVITTKIPLYDNSGKIVGTMGLTRDMTVYANLEKERSWMFMNSLAVLNRALEMRDPYTFRHATNVSIIAEQIANELGWDENRCLFMRLAGEIHDVGKISIPLDILNKPGALSGLEYQLVQKHVENCYNLIKDVKFPFPLSEIVYQHHERLDGSGYPRGLKSGEILSEARILAVSDVLESMTSHRPYRAALGLDSAIAELRQGSGVKYDSQIVDVALNLIKKNNATLPISLS